MHKAHMEEAWFRLHLHIESMLPAMGTISANAHGGACEIASARVFAPSRLLAIGTTRPPRSRESSTQQTQQHSCKSHQS
eukprot:6187519-Pleurochrysis_carterae.AAC.2